MKKYLPAIFLSIAFVLLLFFLNGHNSLNFTENIPQSITPTAVPTEVKLQTYQNEKYGFELQYPSNLVVNINNDLTTFKNTPSQEHAPFYVGVNKSLTIKKRIVELNKYYSVSQQNVSFNDVNFTEVSYSNDTEKVLEYWLEKNGDLLSFGNDTKILSTFKFLPDISTWKTYKNEKYGFEFKYPNNYFIQSIDGQTCLSSKKFYLAIDHGCPTEIKVGVRLDSISMDNLTNELIGSIYDSHNLTKSKLNYPLIGYKLNGLLDSRQIRPGLASTDLLIQVPNNIEIVDINYIQQVDIPPVIFDQILSTFKFIPNATTWKTYKNDKLGYSFQYPDEWQLDESAVSDVKRVRVFDNKNEGSVKPPLVTGNISVELIGNRDYSGWSYDRYLKYLETGGQSEGDVFEKSLSKRIGKTTVGGVSAYLAEGGCCGGAKHSAFIIRNDKVYEIYLLARAGELEPNVKEYNQIFNKILSTFKFLNQSKDVDTTNTYSNPSLGIKFDYSPIFTLDTSNVSSFDSQSPDNRWMVTLNTKDGDQLNIQSGTPADWPDCTDRIDSKKISSALDMSYFKETNSKADYCKGGEDYIGWYATIKKDDKTSWFISMRTKDISKVNQTKLETPFLELIKSFNVVQ